jgi:hypothetical protein
MADRKPRKDVERPAFWKEFLYGPEMADDLNRQAAEARILRGGGPPPMPPAIRPEDQRVTHQDLQDELKGEFQPRSQLDEQMQLAQLIRRPGYQIPVPRGAGPPAGPYPIRQVPGPTPQIPITPEMMRATG